MSVPTRLALCVIALALMPAPAHAQSDEERARVFFEEGVALAKKEQWAAALERFDREQHSCVRATGHATATVLCAEWQHIGKML